MNSKVVTKVLIGFFLVGGLLTYSVPLIEVGFSAVTFRWSAWEMTKPVLKMAFQNKHEEQKPKSKLDFVDFLKKILPKNKEQQPKKMSPEFMIGISAPVALFLSYLLLLLAGIFFLLTKPRLFFSFSALSFVSSAYSLVGFSYLEKIAKTTMSQSVDRYTGKFSFLKDLAKEFVADIVIRPDRALYLLCIFTLFACACYPSFKKEK